MVGKKPNQGDRSCSDHHGADTDDEAHGLQGDRDDDAHDTGGDLSNDIDNEVHSDDDNQDHSHGHEDYAADADVKDAEANDQHLPRAGLSRLP